MPGSERRVLVVVGSLRRESFTRKVAEWMASAAPPVLRLEFTDIGGLPLYNQDLEGAAPDPWIRFREQVRAADAVLFATPEYNRSIPGALKNALDVGSRPYGESAWQGKPAAVMSVSPGALGAFGAHHHLRQALVFLDMPTLQQPEVYLGGVRDLLDEQGRVAKEPTQEFLRGFMRAFADWIETCLRTSPATVR